MGWDNENDTGDWGEDDNDGVWGEDSEAWSDDKRTEARNPLVMKAEDKRSQHVKTTLPVPKRMAPSKEDLLVKYDKNGRPDQCCRMRKDANGKPQQTSAWAKPTADEYNAIMLRAKLVQGGVVASRVNGSTNTQAQMEMVPLGEVEQPAWKKAAKIGVTLAVVGGIGYWGWRKYGNES